MASSEREPGADAPGGGGRRGRPLSVLGGRRRAGVLLHLGSLPGPGPGGTLGEEARRTVRALAAAGFGLWQMLPLGPTHPGGSPYQSLSAHAGNPDFIDLEDLRDAGWLGTDGEAGRRAALGAAAAGFRERADPGARADFARFCDECCDWLEDYCLFMALREEQRCRGWWDWPAALRDRDPGALGAARARLAGELERLRFEQFAFERQWQALRAAAREVGVATFGDMPIFVAEDSADVWAEPWYFRLGADRRATVVAGVPPDYFSADGQRWGNPLYDWERMRADGYRWWLRRFGTELRRHELLRVDHFRGFAACWEIPAADPTAVHGRWVAVPGEELFERCLEHFGRLPLVAEDLGTITEEVVALRRRFGLPGMKVLQFAFSGEASNPYLPHNHARNAVVYTGTHDNDTTISWAAALTPESRAHAAGYFGVGEDGVAAALLRAAFASVARLCVIPMQDALGLGEGARMNAPGTREGNWQWRFDWAQWTEERAAWLRELNERYGRV